MEESDQMNNTTTKNKYTINYVSKKDIFYYLKQRISTKEKGCSVIVPHLCNNTNVFGGSFANLITKHYPIVKENYHMSVVSQKLGTTQFVETEVDPIYRHKIIFANMIAQNGFKTLKNPRPINYAALVYSMNSIKTYIRDFKNSDENTSIEIHCPKFGCGSCGGDWNFISKLIEDMWVDISNIYVYQK